MDLSTLSPIDLLRLNAHTLVELRDRGFIRTLNAPLGDYAEYLFCKAFVWKIADNSAKDYDATDPQGKRYQIKARRLVKSNTSRQLGALRRLTENNFEVLGAVLFRADFTVLKAALIPHSVVLAGAKKIDATKSWRFMLHDAVWNLDGVQDVAEELRNAQFVA